MPSYVTVNNGAEIKSLNIKNECLKCIKNSSICGQVANRITDYIVMILFLIDKFSIYKCNIMGKI